MISRCAVVWNEAPESNTQDSIWLSTERSKASRRSSVVALAESCSFFFLASLQLFLKWPILPQFQHCTCFPDLDLLLPLQDFDLPRFELLLVPLSLVSRFKAELEVDASPVSLLRTSSLRIWSRIS
ncbi:hypothetical protein CIPAW_13G024000 [Carya illinoinensis]|uniref:Uncharacterized protein n=1 Tax=Carya illinoinensis TaxID=32201 RepID=A0A8T1NNR2_CARIL|nr:hypothetical protein CIPAW_13G024000 [Carya illinoinensis]